MKILMINHFPLTGSGSGVYTMNIAKSLKNKGHEVCIIMPENISNYDKVDGIKLHPVFFKNTEEIEGQLPFNFPCFTTHPRSILNFYDLTDEQIKMYVDAFKKAIDEEVREFKPDIIHGQHIWILSSLGADYGIPMVVTAHGTDLIGHNKDAKFHYYSNKAANEAKKIITISENNNDLVKKTFESAKDKTVMLKNGYDNNVFYPQSYNKKEVLKSLGIEKEYKNVVSFVGKLTEIKGVDVLLKAAKQYEDENTLTLIAGNGELFDSLNNLAKELGLKNVKFLGNQNHATLRSIYNIADVSVVPSRSEAFGLVAIEAMACGVPVVGSNEGGIKDIINDRVGSLVEVDDVDGFAKAIKEVLSKEKVLDRNEVAKYAKDKYSQDSLIDGLIDVYKTCL